MCKVAFVFQNEELKLIIFFLQGVLLSLLSFMSN